jgi:hypothetical protein
VVSRGGTARQRQTGGTFRATRSVLIADATVAAVGWASTSFRSTWRAPGAEPLDFRGKKVAALIVSKEEGIRYGAEDALGRAEAGRPEGRRDPAPLDRLQRLMDVRQWKDKK